MVRNYLYRDLMGNFLLPTIDQKEVFWQREVKYSLSWPRQREYF
ncbi:hypothetical protein [Persicitalea jodogahamensis]